MKVWRSPKYLSVLRLMVGVALLLVTLPDVVAMPHEGGVLTTGNYTSGTHTDHHCPANSSEPTHHCPQCCVLSHSFVNESCQSLPFVMSGDCGVAVVLERIAIGNLLPDTIFHPPENL